MNKLILTAILVILAQVSFANAADFYDFKIKDTSGELYSFSNLKGKVVILSNIATRCGFTGQLDDLEKVYLKYKDKNLVVVGIPSNDFLSQTPEANKEVANFCRLKYGVTFPILEKQVVVGDNASELVKWIHTQKGYEGKILWNFEKFIVDKNGKVMERFRSMTNPSDSDFIKSIEKYLN
jgi:glutathione peroxidase